MYVFNNTDGSTGSGYSSKGNQLKFGIDNKWYKADFLGYEGAAEYAASKLLEQSNIMEYVPYQLEMIAYNGHSFNGCVSNNFLRPGQRLITAERLYQAYYNKSVKEVLEKSSLQDRIPKFVEDVTNITGLENFGKYITILLEFDAYILNEDRHFHNIAVIQNEDKSFSYCPVFDNGAAFLSDTRNDYPLEKNTYGLISGVKAKPFSHDFDKQVECCRKLYGTQFKVEQFNMKEATAEIKEMYGDKVYTRICEVEEHQKMMYPEFVSDDIKPVSFNDMFSEEKKETMKNKIHQKKPRSPKL